MTDSSTDWKDICCNIHENEMIKILKEACELC